MAGIATRAPAQPVQPAQAAGRYPGLQVGIQAGRKATRSGLLWGLVFGLYVAVQTLAYTSAYKTQAARHALESAYGGNLGLNALIGPARAIGTVAGYAAWRLLGVLSILGAIWGLLTATRLLRGEEDAGRLELLLAGPTTRRRAAVQALAGLGAGLAALFVMTAAGTIITGHVRAVDFSVSRCIYFSVTLVAGAAVFLAVGALTSQLAGTRRQAAAMAGTVFGFCYAVRMVADSESGLHWLVWLSPLGWIEESRPLTSPRPLALLPVLLLIIVIVAVTVRLAGVRDLGAAFWRQSDSARPRLALTSGPVRLALLELRLPALGWLFGITAFSVLLGTVAESSDKDATGDRPVQQAISRVGGHGSPVAAYLGLTFLILALAIALIAAGQATAIRSEEADGHLENLTVRTVSRSSWLRARLLLAAALVLMAGVLAGIGTWTGTIGQHSTISAGSLLAAGVNVVAPSLLLLGLGALVFGLRPRWTALVVYGYLAWSFLVEFIGAAVQVSHWILDTSVFFHIAPAPVTSPDWASVAIIAGLGVAGALAGGFALNRRDLAGS